VSLCVPRSVSRGPSSSPSALLSVDPSICVPALCVRWISIAHPC